MGGALGGLTTSASVYDTAFGYASATRDDTTGTDNTAVGFGALDDITTGNYNTAVGYGTLDYALPAPGTSPIGFEAGHAYNLGESNNIILFDQGSRGKRRRSGFGNRGTCTSATYIAGIYGVREFAATLRPCLRSTARATWARCLAAPWFRAMPATQPRGPALFRATRAFTTRPSDRTPSAPTPAGTTRPRGFPASAPTPAGSTRPRGPTAFSTGNSGWYNTASGYSSLGANTTGANNTATGYNSLAANTTGIDNTAAGYQALSQNKTGGSNTADGFLALENTTGSGNTAVGGQAGQYLEAARTTSLSATPRESSTAPRTAFPARKATTS